MNNNDTPALKRKPSLDQPPVHNKRGRPPLDRNNYPKQQTSSARTEEPSAFDRGFEAEKILGATDATVNIILLFHLFIIIILRVN